MAPEQDARDRRLGGATATLLVVANMVGAGVFTTTGLLLVDLRSSATVLLAWLFGGVLALCGALAYGELVAALPRNGGEYQLLSRIFHPAVGFVAGWISLVVGFSAPVAASALAFGLYLHAIAPQVPVTAAALVLVIALSALHAVHVTVGSRAQNVLVVAKVSLIVVFIVGGTLLGDPAQAWSGGGRAVTETVLSPAFAVGLIFVSFAYSGWNGAAYLAGEIRAPAKALPLALIGGTATVVVLYLGLNAVFLSAAPTSELTGVVEIGHVAATRLFGARAGAFLSGAIALALVSSISAMIMAGPRVYQIIGQDYRPLAFLQYRTTRGGPAAAVALQAVVAIAMVVTASFGALLTYIGFTLSLVAGLTVVGVFVLRLREPDLERPYRTWGYPVTPALFVGLSTWMVAHALVERPVVALAGLATIASGLGLYALLTLLARRQAQDRPHPT